MEQGLIYAIIIYTMFHDGNPWKFRFQSNVVHYYNFVYLLLKVEWQVLTDGTNHSLHILQKCCFFHLETMWNIYFMLSC